MSKILLINSVCGTGSTGKICMQIAKEYEAAGHEVKIAYGRSADVPEECGKYAILIGSDFDVRLHGICTRIFDNHGLCSRRATRAFLRWADAFDPDVLWLHNIHGYYLNYEMLFAWIKSRPSMEVKWTLHDCWAFTGHCAYFTYAQCDKWKDGCGSCPQKAAYPGSRVFDRSGRNYIQKKASFCGVKNLKLITPSRWLANLVSESFLRDYPVEVVYNTINTELFKPTPGDFKKYCRIEDKKMILGVANIWEPRKGLNDFLKLAELLDDSYVIVLVGLSAEQIQTLPKNIIGIKRTDSAKQLAEIYTAADVFVNPTYEDNYPTVNLEAEACGTRVITYMSGGAPETVKRPDSVAVPCGAEHIVTALDNDAAFSRTENER